jgi:hypothetical protein
MWAREATAIERKEKDDGGGVGRTVTSPLPFLSELWEFMINLGRSL